MTKEDFITAIKSMSVLELNELSKALQEEFGVSASVPMGMPMGGFPEARWPWRKCRAMPTQP